MINTHPKVKPEAQCIPCLYRCGFGVRRIEKRLGYNRASVSKTLKRLSIAMDSEARRTAENRKRRLAPTLNRKTLAAQFKAEWKGVKADDCPHWAMHPAVPSPGMLDYYRNHEANKARSAANAKRYYCANRHDPTAYIKRTYRTRLYNVLKSASLGKKQRAKRHRSHIYLGCTYDQLMRHIESMFAPGMTWQNMGRSGWHIDHIIPCKAFDLTRDKEARQCFHWSNLQPLWEDDNIRKGDKRLVQSTML